MILSIIIPCFNAEKTIAEALRSTEASASTIETIVIDDGSTDNSLDIARTFGPNVRVLSGSNRGVSAARNRGIHESRGDWIIFLDADDVLRPGTVEKRLAKAELAGADVVISDWEEIDATGETIEGSRRSVDWTALQQDAELAIANGVWATTAAILYRRSIVEAIGGFRADLPVIQDARFLFDAAFLGARFAHAAHVGARYRIAPGSLSRRSPEQFATDILLNGQQIEALWRASGTFDDARQQAIAGVYNCAAAGLLYANSPLCTDAFASLHRLGAVLSRHNRIAAPLVRTLGVSLASTAMTTTRSVGSWLRFLGQADRTSTGAGK